MAVLAQAEAMRRVVEQARTLNRSPTGQHKRSRTRRRPSPPPWSRRFAALGEDGRVSGEAARAALAARAADRPARLARAWRPGTASSAPQELCPHKFRSDGW